MDRAIAIPPSSMAMMTKVSSSSRRAPLEACLATFIARKAETSLQRKSSKSAGRRLVFLQKLLQISSAGLGARPGSEPELFLTETCFG